MIWQGQELVRVTSRGELKAGLMVVISPCNKCGRTSASLIVRRHYESDPYGHVDGTPCPGVGWVAVPTPCCEDPNPLLGSCFCADIRYGSLYRLQEPPAEANDYDVVAAPTKAKERTR